jgi:pyridoxal phosphate enzyme (YggS family)
MNPRDRLKANLDAVEQRIAHACERARRNRADITLVAVTKTVSSEIAAMLVELGVRDLGESRPQELWSKSEVITDINWHLIGHLQRNKIERTLPIVHAIHAVDSVRLLQALDAEASKQNRTIPIMLEINASGEASKHGFAPSEVPGLAPMIASMKQVQVRGLMTMAALQDAEACRPTFATLRTLRDQLQSLLPNQRIDQLSMGMSNDYEIAIEEGATHIRLGSVLFDGVIA